MSEMKPCPFCGEQVSPPLASSLDDGYTRCGLCGAKMQHRRWQTRPIEDELRKRIAELESLVERLIEIGDWATIGMVISNSYSLTSEIRKLAEDRHDEWRMLVKGWKSSKQKEAYDLDEYKDNPEERER